MTQFLDCPSFGRTRYRNFFLYSISGSTCGLEVARTPNTTRIRLGHESLDVTLAYLKGKDAESKEAQEHANSSNLPLYA